MAKKKAAKKAKKTTKKTAKKATKKKKKQFLVSKLQSFITLGAFTKGFFICTFEL